MINVLGRYKVRTFEYLYMFVMVIYMAQMTNDTGRMVGSLTGNPIPLLIPVVLTLILLGRHKVSFFNRNLGMVLLLTTLWSVCIIVKEKLYSTQELSYIFFLYYAIIIAYIHCQVFGRRLFALFESIMVFFAVISLPLWLFEVLLPDAAASFFQQFPKTGFGHNFLYLFNYTSDFWKAYAVPRNAGCSWEPGRYAIMLCLAICFNLLRKGVTFRNNGNVIWLLLSLASTQSTTGYSIALLLYVIFFIKRARIQYILGFFMIVLPVVYSIFQLNFMGVKIQDQLDAVADPNMIEETFSHADATLNKGEYGGALDRFQAIYFEFQNIVADPVLGYGRNASHSYFSRNISAYFGLTGGILKLIGQMGIPFGLYFYCILFRSSAVIADENEVKKRLAVFFIILLASVSYVTFCIPVFTAVWFYSLFAKHENHYNN